MIVCVCRSCYVIGGIGVTRGGQEEEGRERRYWV